MDITRSHTDSRTCGWLCRYGWKITERPPNRWSSAQWHSKCIWTNIWAYQAGELVVKWQCSYKNTAWVTTFTTITSSSDSLLKPGISILKTIQNFLRPCVLQTLPARHQCANWHRDSTSHILHWKQIRLLLLKKSPIAVVVGDRQNINSLSISFSPGWRACAMLSSMSH
jgi:hypothetical protein